MAVQRATPVTSRKRTVVHFASDQTLGQFQQCVRDIYGLPDDRQYSLADLLVNQERFAMRALKGIRKGDVKKVTQNLLIAFSWTLGVCNRLHSDAEEIVWRRFPMLCSYCGQKPCVCKAQKPTSRAQVVRHAARRPGRLVDFQDMFRQIYPSARRSLADAGVHLAEETGEVGEAAHWFLGEHKQVQFEQLEMELADWISCMFGVANSAGINVAAALAGMYTKNCHVCHAAPCLCSFSTVGRFRS